MTTHRFLSTTIHEWWFRLLQQDEYNDDNTSNNSNSMEEDEDVAAEQWSETEEGISWYLVVFLSLLALVLILSKCLHDRPRLAAVLPEAGMTIIVGMIAGGIVYVSSLAHDDQTTSNTPNDNNEGGEEEEVEEVARTLLSFSATTFFTALLPPIIFNSGYHVNRELFLLYLHPITLYAVLGTFVSTLIIALLLQLAVSTNLTGGFHPHFSELLTFGALISATDPVSTLAVFQQKRVDPQLFYLVFGESVLNDAVGLVTFNAFSKLVGHVESLGRGMEIVMAFLMDVTISFAGSLFLGVICGITAGWLLKLMDFRHTRLVEVSLYVLVMYLPFFAAEVFGMSGIVTILFTGIAAKRYAEPNLSIESESDADVFFRVTAHLAEMSIFLELGLSVVGSFARAEVVYWGFVGWAVLACLVGRVGNVYPITWWFNRIQGHDGFGREVLVAGVEEGDEPSSTGPSSSTTTTTTTRTNTTSREALELDGSEYHNHSSSNHNHHHHHQNDLSIQMKTAHMLWFSGLRGAVAYACAKSFPNDVFGNRHTFQLVTMMVVLVTVFFMGGTTEVMLKVLDVDVGVDGDKYVEERGHLTSCNLLRRIDEHLIFPCVIRNYGSQNMPTSPRDQQIVTVDAENPTPSSGRSSPVAPSNMSPAAAATAAAVATSASTLELQQQQRLHVPNDLELHQSSQQEMAALERAEILRQMGLEYITRANYRRKGSLYDYGSR